MNPASDPERVGAGLATRTLHRRSAGAQWLLRLTLLTLVLRALVPVGYMPTAVAWANPSTSGHAASSLSSLAFLTLCPTGLSSASYALLSSSGPQPLSHGHHSSELPDASGESDLHTDHGSAADSLVCVFGSSLLEGADLALNGMAQLPSEGAVTREGLLTAPVVPRIHSAHQPRAPPVTA